MMKTSILKTLFVLLLSILPYLSYAEVPGTISFQGYLSDDAGVPINGPTDITFSIPGTEWNEQHPSVPVNNGVFSVMLGNQVSLANIDFGQVLQLHIVVNGISQSIPISSVPYAFHAKTVEDDSDILKSLLCSSGQVAEWNGSSWICADNASGPEGKKGEKGDKGDTGPKGLQGEKGDKGDTGAQGVAGPQGENGDKGDTGAQGPTGEKGATGAQGPKGDKGDTGPQGVAGPTGAQGPKGEKGDTGPQGVAGPTGAQGPQGKKGDTGAQGIAGPEGPRGLKGDAGPEGPTMPIGSITAWHKDLPGVPSGLPEGWVSCDGQLVYDDNSPLNGQRVPDLNSSGLFLRGGLTSGIEQEENDHYIDNMNTNVNTGPLPAGYVHEIVPKPGEATGRLYVGRDNSNAGTYPMEVHVKGGEVRPKNLSIVWIMKIK